MNRPTRTRSRAVNSRPGLTAVLDLEEHQPSDAPYFDLFPGGDSFHAGGGSSDSGPSDPGVHASKQSGMPPFRRIRVMVVDDHQLVREGIRSVLEMYPALEVVAEAADGETAVSRALQVRPDVVIMDINMPRLNGIEATRRITSADSKIKVVGLTVYDEDHLSRAMMAAGASAFLTKGAHSEALVEAIRASVGRP